MDEKSERLLGVAVITPSGTFPNDDDLRRAREGEKIEVVLALAAKALNLMNTSDWVASVNNRDVSPSQTFREAGLSCVVEIEWHKQEGGGGAPGVFAASL